MMDEFRACNDMREGLQASDARPALRATTSRGQQNVSAMSIGSMLGMRKSRRFDDMMEPSKCSRFTRLHATLRAQPSEFVCDGVGRFACMFTPVLQQRNLRTAARTFSALTSNLPESTCKHRHLQVLFCLYSSLTHSLTHSVLAVPVLFLFKSC